MARAWEIGPVRAARRIERDIEPWCRPSWLRGATQVAGRARGCRGTLTGHVYEFRIVEIGDVCGVLTIEDGSPNGLLLFMIDGDVITGLHAPAWPASVPGGPADRPA